MAKSAKIRRRNRLLSLLILLLLAVAVAAIFMQKKPEAENAKIISASDAPQGGDFTLTSAEGPVSLHDYRGKLVLLYFGYTYCPDICPTNLGNLSLAYRRLPPEIQKKVKILFVSVDTDRDTPAKLQQYSDYYQANITGLTGTREQIDQVVKQYGAIYRIHKEGNNPNYSVDHSAFTYVISPEGKLLTQLPHATSPDQFIDTITQYLGA